MGEKYTVCLDENCQARELLRQLNIFKSAVLDKDEQIDELIKKIERLEKRNVNTRKDQGTKFLPSRLY
jgi:hypothetical protein